MRLTILGQSAGSLCRRSEPSQLGKSHPVGREEKASVTFYALVIGAKWIRLKNLSVNRRQIMSYHYK